jgi:hypothetical protein
MLPLCCMQKTLRRFDGAQRGQAQGRLCANSWCKASFEVTDGDLAFYDRVSPVIAGKKHPLPPPLRCPDCRQQRRISHCNERHLYPGQCALCGCRTLTQFPPHRNQLYYCRECWHSDRWDPADFGRDVDFSRPFFEQILELKCAVPSLALDVQGELINSDYIHYAGSCKNCYLIMHADFNEDCYYGYGFKKNRSCVDGFYNLHCELCYDCIDCHKCYGLKGCQDCINCSSSAFLRDCIGCNHCFLCVGLREKSYCFDNQQLSKEEWMRRMATVHTGSYRQYSEMKQRRRDLDLRHTFKEFQGHNLENALGNYLVNCKNVYSCFDCEDVENAKYCCQLVLGAKNIYDVYQYGTNFQESLECVISGENSYHALFCIGVNMSCSDLFYCWYMETSKNCFGCANMKGRRHCILNKQYAQEDYENLVQRIIEHMRGTGEWGEFFPMSHALFGYNRSTAAVWFPLTKDEASTRGAHWDDKELPSPQVQKVVPAVQIPDDIRDVPDDLLQWAISCEVTQKPFKIIPQELQFYREQKIPLPRRSPDQRHVDRFHVRNPRKFWVRQCGRCRKDITTTWSPDRPEIVYCESCYLASVY